VKPTKFALIISACIVIVFLITFVISHFLGDVLGKQGERNYQRFVQNVDGLTETFHQPVEDCATKELENNDIECIKKLEDEYRVQFGSLIKLFGYESHIQELYQYWQADLRFWYEVKKIEIQNQGSESKLIEINKIEEIRNNAVKARNNPSFMLTDSNSR